MLSPLAREKRDAFKAHRTSSFIEGSLVLQSMFVHGASFRRFLSFLRKGGLEQDQTRKCGRPTGASATNQNIVGPLFRASEFCAMREASLPASMMNVPEIAWLNN